MQLDKSTSSYTSFLHNTMAEGETFELSFAAEKSQLAPTDRYLPPPQSSSFPSLPFPSEHEWLRHNYLTQQQLRWQQKLSKQQSEIVLPEMLNKN